MSDLAKRAVECKHWRWMPGMSIDGMVVVDADESGLDVARKGIVQEWPGEHAYPDLTDPATRGALLALVREAWGDPYMTTDYWRGPRVWTCKSDEVHSMGACRRAPKGPTEAAALVAALEAAP